MHRYVIADVFTDRPFTGNQLAVFPDARDIPENAMQAIAREFNFSETTFVLPNERVRIFTPKNEMPFAGHPTVGTAAVLAHLRKLALPARMVLVEGIGPVPVDLEQRGAHIHAQFTIEKPVEVPPDVPEKSAAAAALSLSPSDVLDAWFANGGVKFCFVKLVDKAAVDRAQLDRSAWAKHFKDAWASSLYLFSGDTRIYSRMFPPRLGIEEDPATGSAAVALASVLAARDSRQDAILKYPIDQGVAMGRPSKLEASAEKRSGRIVHVKVGGATVISAEGHLHYI